MPLLIELILDKDKNGISAISLVDSPAILTNFIKLRKDAPKIKFVTDEEKRIVLGPALIPNVKIYRTAESMGLDQDSYVYFSEETIKEISEIYLATLKNNEVTLDHETETDDVKMIESWIVEDTQRDKSAFYGFELPVGTWCVAFKIFNDDIWEQVKDGNLKGFSIEAEAFAMLPKGELNFSVEEDTRKVIPVEMHTKILEKFKKVGTTLKELNKNGWELVVEGDQFTEKGLRMAIEMAITSEPDDESSLDKGNYAIRYRYSGPRDDKNRDFCAQMLDNDLIFRREDVENMTLSDTNNEFGSYDIFEYKGSYNCRHKWERLVFQKGTSNIGNTPVEGYYPVAESDLPDSYIPSDNEATSINAKKQAISLLSAIDILSTL